jgi:hypothetical protein
LESCLPGRARGSGQLHRTQLVPRGWTVVRAPRQPAVSRNDELRMGADGNRGTGRVPHHGSRPRVWDHRSLERTHPREESGGARAPCNAGLASRGGARLRPARGSVRPRLRPKVCAPLRAGMGSEVKNTGSPSGPRALRIDSGCWLRCSHRVGEEPTPSPGAGGQGGTHPDRGHGRGAARA